MEDKAISRERVTCIFLPLVFNATGLAGGGQTVAESGVLIAFLYAKSYAIQN